MSGFDPENENPLSPPWGRHDLGPGEERRVRLGPLELRLKRAGEEIWLAQHWAGQEPDRPAESARGSEDAVHTMEDGVPPSRDPGEAGRSSIPGAREESGAEESGAKETEPTWSRWAVPEGTGGLRLEPAFPDRPLVVEPEQTFHLVRGARVRIYVRVPLWVSVTLPAPSTTSLVAIPTHILSDTWFGDFAEGELAYALPTSARREVSPDIFAPHLAICPLVLGNDAVDRLEVKKLCLRVAHLSVFARGPELWSDETRVRYQGEEQESQIRISGKVPPEAPNAVRITTPRVPLARGFRARTFARLADLSGLGASS